MTDMMSNEVDNSGAIAQIIASNAQRVKPANILDRAEIDAILNNTNRIPGDGPLGMERLVHGGLVSYERLPMLEVVFDRLVRILAINLRNLTQDNVEVTLEAITSRRFGECLEEVQTPAMLAVFRAEEWDNFGLIIIEPAMIFAIVEVMMGGRRIGSELGPARNFTSIERNLVERLVRLVLSDLTTSFAPICTATLGYERMETDPRFAMISRISSAAILARLNVTISKRNAGIVIVLPYATIEPVRELLLQQFMGEKFGRDSIWETHLAEELRYTDIDLEAVLDEQVVSLGTVMAMTPGTVLQLNARVGGAITFRCGGVPLFEARPGMHRGRIAAIIDRAVSRAQA